jgi:hypothetical protein
MKKPVTISMLKKKTLNLYSELVKLRAYSEGKLFCYTCDCKLELRNSNTHLGHYLSRGAYPGLTFHPENSRTQCYRCNCHLHGNTIEFRERLIAEIGLERVEQLESQRHIQLKMTRSDYHELINKFNEEIRQLKI